MLSQGRVTNMIRGPGKGKIASWGKIKSACIRQAQLNDVQGRWDNSWQIFERHKSEQWQWAINTAQELLWGAGVILNIPNICHGAGWGSSSACVAAPEHRDLRYGREGWKVKYLCLSLWLTTPGQQHSQLLQELWAGEQPAPYQDWATCLWINGEGKKF